jgi:arylsulfatase A-like enzyme
VSVGLWFVAACHSTPERPNLLLIDVDTLRADRLGRERDGVPVMPNAEALARRGTRFDTMVAQSGWTVPALEALLTGRPPVGALFDGAAANVPWVSADRTVAEVLSLYGYRTAVFYGPTIAGNLPVFRRGFDDVDQIDPLRPGPVVDVVEWLGSRPTEPWFALVHTLDLHQIPALSRVDRDRFAPGHPEPCMEASHDDFDYTRTVAAWTEVLGLEGARDLAIAHYDAAAAHADDELGRIVEAIHEQRYDTSTVIAFTSNHGEELFEHGEFTHAKPYEFDLRVPLVIYDPRNTAPVPTVRVMVQTIDLAPTLLELAGIPIDRTMDGRSLVPLLQASPGYEERAVVSISGGTRLSMRTPTRHLLRCSVPGCTLGPERGPATLVQELYDPIADPAELRDLSTAEPDTVATLGGALDRFVTESKERPVEKPSVVPDSFVQALRERGYWTTDE